MAAAAFWIAVAAFLIAAGYFKLRGETLRHETLRRVIEKTGVVDEERLRELLQPPPTPEHKPWVSPQGDTYRFFRGFGVLILSVAVGIVLFFSIVYYGGDLSREDLFIGYGAASLVTMVGLGFILSARFCEKPPRKESERKDLL